MQRLHFEDWTIDVDIETTRKYNGIEGTVLLNQMKNG